VLTIDGENLGFSSNDTSVTVAGLNCDVVEYRSAVRYIYHWQKWGHCIIKSCDL